MATRVPVNAVVQFRSRRLIKWLNKINSSNDTTAKLVNWKAFMLLTSMEQRSLLCDESKEFQLWRVQNRNQCQKYLINPRVTVVVFPVNVFQRVFSSKVAHISGRKKSTCWRKLIYQLKTSSTGNTRGIWNWISYNFHENKITKLISSYLVSSATTARVIFDWNSYTWKTRETMLWK